MLAQLLRRLFGRHATPQVTPRASGQASPAQATLAAGIGLLEGDEPARARAVAQALHATAPAQAAYLLSLIEEQAGDPAAALAQVQAAIDGDAAEPVYWLQAARLQVRHGDGLAGAQWYARLLALPDPPFAQDPRLWFEAAGAWERLREEDRAIDCLQQALALDGGFAEARANLAMLQQRQGRSEEARAQLQVVLLTQDRPALRLRRALMLPLVQPSGEALHERRRLFEAELDAIAGGPAFTLAQPHLEVGMTAFLLAYQGMNDAPLMRKLAGIIRRAWPAAGRRCDRPLARGRRLRVGFVSAHFHDHSVARTTHGLIHDLQRRDFEVLVFAIGPRRDRWRALICAAAEAAVELPADFDRVRDTLADAQLDVLIHADLGMDPLTYYLAFWQLAPIQMTTWGHSVTSGIDSVAHYISAAQLEEAGHAAHYSENLIRLPGYYMPRYEAPQLPGRPATRADLGLAERAHLYCCPQSPYKLHPDFDAALRGILERDPQARIVLLANPVWAGWLGRRFAATLGGHAGRVDYLGNMPQSRFLEVMAAADVLLDPFHFGGCNSSSEALGLGVPLVTLPGEFLRGRFTLGSYRELELTDCIAATPDGYVDLAVGIACDPERRRALGAAIAQRAPALFGRPDAGVALGEALLQVVAAAR